MGGASHVLSRAIHHFFGRPARQLPGGSPERASIGFVLGLRGRPHSLSITAAKTRPSRSAPQLQSARSANRSSPSPAEQEKVLQLRPSTGRSKRARYIFDHASHTCGPGGRRSQRRSSGERRTIVKRQCRRRQCRGWEGACRDPLNSRPRRGRPQPTSAKACRRAQTPASRRWRRRAPSSDTRGRRRMMMHTLCVVGERCTGSEVAPAAPAARL